MFLVPAGGGLAVEDDGITVQLVAPQSPIAQALTGARVGELVVMAGRSGTVLAVK